METEKIAEYVEKMSHEERVKAFVITGLMRTKALPNEQYYDIIFGAMAISSQLATQKALGVFLKAKPTEQQIAITLLKVNDNIDELLKKFDNLMGLIP